MKKNIFCWALVIVCCAFSAGCAKKSKVAENLDSLSNTSEVVADSGDRSGQSDTSGLRVGNAQLGMKGIYFEFDSYTLSEDSKQTLQANAEWLKANPTASIVIEGHTDERGSDVYNMALGENRARSASNYLVSLGVSAERVRIISYGEEKPAVMGQGEGVWSKNRRAEFM
ncbi:peptidoglycan-associated lipoprotein Pal [Trichloromonas sp.]|uniref:peptidoglycan-associated lipoprotein Pal n=1 Tax=Trichloromonas sp. TaxID=3069249 RepID=UPI003D815439